MDYFDESIVLLRRLHCWKEEDILSRSPTGKPLSEQYHSIASDVADFNKLDDALYARLNMSFFRTVREAARDL